MDTYRDTEDKSPPETYTERAERAYAWFQVHHEKVAIGFGVLLVTLLAIASPLFFALILAIFAGLASIAGAVLYVAERNPAALLIVMGSIGLTVASVCVVEALDPFADVTPACECEGSEGGS